MTNEEISKLDEILSHFIKETFKINNLENWELTIKETILKFIKKHEYYPEYLYLNNEQFMFIQNQIINNKMEVLKYDSNEDIYNIVHINNENYVHYLFYDAEIINFYGVDDVDKDTVFMMVDAGSGELIPVLYDGDLFFNLGESD